MIYCFGGFRHPDPAPGHLNEIVEFDPVNGTAVVKTETLPTPRSNLSCAGSLTGKIYCFGGVDDTQNFDEILEYDPSNDIVDTKSATLLLSAGNHACDAHLATGKIYCLRQSGQTFAEYDIQSDSIQFMEAFLPPPSNNAVGCVYSATNQRYYCAGGYSASGGFTYTDEFTEYEPPNCGIPTVSTWGLIVMTLMLAVVARFAFRRVCAAG